MTPSPIVGASAHRWPMDLRTDALRNHHPRMPQYSAKSIYENVYKVLKDLADNRDEYLKQYKENFEMCKKEYGL